MHPSHSPSILLDTRDPSVGDGVRVCFRLVVAAVSVGVVLRVVQYLHNVSYWNDEAAIVLNVFRRDFRELLQPLDFAQAAPPLFLWAQRAIYLFAGPSEFAMRSLPVLLGLLSLPLFAILAWRTLRPIAAVWAVAFFSINDRIIPHVSEVKQYSSDLFFSVLLFYAAFGHGRPISPVRRLARVSAVATVAFWFSFPSVILFGGIVLALLPPVVRGRRAITSLAACMLPPLASAGLLAKLVFSHPRDPYLNTFWASQFAPRQFVPFLTWLGRALYELGDYPFFSLGVIVLILVVVGAVVLRRDGRQALLGAVLCSIALAVVASAMRVYPFDGSRITLYLVPPLFLLVAAGAEPSNRPAASRFRRGWWILPAPLLAIAMLQTGAHAVRPGARSNIRPVVQYVQAHRRADEAVYLVGAGEMPQERVSGRKVEFLCYWQGSEEGIFRRIVSLDQITQRRFWVVYSLNSTEKLAKVNPLLDSLDAIADRQGRFTAGPAGAILYQRAERAATKPSAK